MPDYPPGTPSWVDLGSPDPDAAARFYKEVFGWEAEQRGDPEQTGGYRTFTLSGKSVGGLMPLMNEQQPPAWSTYISVADADETMAKVKDAGGQALMEPMDVMDLGRMAFFMDSTGAALGVWQPKAHTGAEFINKPGALCWNELSTREPDKAKEFYGAVFGWEPDVDESGPIPYTRWTRGEDDIVAGMMEMGDQFPPEVPSHWGVCFAVEDTDAAVAKVEPAGGKVMVPPTDIPIGRFSVMTDPQGVQFAVITLAAQSREVGEKRAAAFGAA